jgi:elongation factor Ts
MMITAQQVKELREKTGAPMMDCKNALVEANGDLAAAEIVLRKKGIATAQKKAGRSALEGLVAVVARPAVGALLEINCESDFVARTDDFQELLKSLAEQIAASDPGGVDALLARPYAGDGAQSVRDVVGAKVGKLGENIVVRRFARYALPAGSLLGSYVHHGKIGVLVEGAVDGPAGPAAPEILKDLAMHIAASDPRFLSRADVDAAALQTEREIQTERARAEGKPEKVLEKIVEGRLSKFYEENCLLDQPFVRDTNMSVGQWLASRVADAGKITVRRFTRYKVGEGLAKEA